MGSLRDTIVDRLDRLPDATLREVLDFVDFLAWRGSGGDEPLLDASGVLPGAPLSSEQIERELYGP